MMLINLGIVRLLNYIVWRYQSCRSWTFPMRDGCFNWSPGKKHSTIPTALIPFSNVGTGQQFKKGSPGRLLKKSTSGVLSVLRGSSRTVQGTKHWALTNLRPSANVTLLIRRVADLAAALLDSLW